MYPLNDLVAQYRQQEIEQAARHPSQLMAYDLRRARRCTRRQRKAVTSPGGGPPVAASAPRAVVVRATHAAIVVLVAMTLLSGFVTLG